jgi:hypothetical protein
MLPCKLKSVNSWTGSAEILRMIFIVLISKGGEQSRVGRGKRRHTEGQNHRTQSELNKQKKERKKEQGRHNKRKERKE